VARPAGKGRFPGLGWLRQPEDYSDREWILEIAREYNGLTNDSNANPRQGGS
jgi:hypothetical protein